MFRIFLGATELPDVSLLGLKSPLSDLHEHQFFQLGVSNGAFKLRILPTQLLELFRDIITHPVIALPPLVKRGGTDTDCPACEFYRDTLSQNLMTALQKPDNLLRRMILSTSHNNRAFAPTKGELRPANQVDPPQGVMPRRQEGFT